MPIPDPVYTNSQFNNPTNTVMCSQCSTIHGVTDYTYLRLFGNAYEGRDGDLQLMHPAPFGLDGDGSIKWSSLLNFVLCKQIACLQDFYLPSPSPTPPVMQFDIESPLTVTQSGPQIDIVTSAQPPAGTFTADQISPGLTNGTWGFDASFATNGLFNLSGYTGVGIASVEIIYTESGNVYTRLYTVIVEAP